MLPLDLHSYLLLLLLLLLIRRVESRVRGTLGPDLYRVLDRNDSRVKVGLLVVKVVGLVR